MWRSIRPRSTARVLAFFARHRLHREISANYVTNSLINRTGPTFINAMVERTGRSPCDVAKAYLVSREVFDMHGLWAASEALDNKVPAEIQIAMHLDVLRLIHRSTLWFLRNLPQPIDISRAINDFGPGIAALIGCFKDILSTDLSQVMDARSREYIEWKVPKELARRIAALDVLAASRDIVGIAQEGGYSVAEVGRISFSLGLRFGLNWLRTAAEGQPPNGEWQKEAVSAIVEDLFNQQSELTTRVLDAAGGTEAAEEVIDDWADVKFHAVERA